jgi:hypothetical protein
VDSSVAAPPVGGRAWWRSGHKDGWWGGLRWAAALVVALGAAVAASLAFSAGARADAARVPVVADGDLFVAERRAHARSYAFERGAPAILADHAQAVPDDRRGAYGAAVVLVMALNGVVVVGVVAGMAASLWPVEGAARGAPTPT